MSHQERNYHVNDSSDTRPFHVDAKEWGGQTISECLWSQLIAQVFR